MSGTMLAAKTTDCLIGAEGLTYLDVGLLDGRARPKCQPHLSLEIGNPLKQAAIGPVMQQEHTYPNALEACWRPQSDSDLNPSAVILKRLFVLLIKSQTHTEGSHEYDLWRCIFLLSGS